TIAPGSSPCSARWVSVRVSTTSAPRRLAARASTGDSLVTPARAFERSASTPVSLMGDRPSVVGQSCRETPAVEEFEKRYGHPARCPQRLPGLADREGLRQSGQRLGSAAGGIGKQYDTVADPQHDPGPLGR